MEKEYKMSAARAQELQEELNYLKTTRSDEVAEQIKVARGFGDLSENSEYDEAKNEQGKLYSRIAEYAAKLASEKGFDEALLLGVLGYTDEAVVSTDFRNESKTSVFDVKAGIQLDPTFVKVCAWYDNEWGYSNKVVEMVRVIAK